MPVDPPTPRRQLNVRLPPDLIKQIEEDGRTNQDVVADAVRAWFEDSSEIADDSEGLPKDSRIIAALTGQLSEKDRQIAELHVMLQTAITPQPQLQAAAEPEAQAEDGRKWWQVWRR